MARFFSWRWQSWQNFFLKTRTQRRAFSGGGRRGRSRPAYKPSLTILEDRLVPSILPTHAYAATNSLVGYDVSFLTQPVQLEGESPLDTGLQSGSWDGYRTSSPRSSTLILLPIQSSAVTDGE
jgi:hypothetical protein